MLLYWWTHVLIHSFVWKHSLYNTRSKSRGKLWTLGNNDGSREGVSVVTNVLLCITRWEKPCLCRGREYIKTLCLPLSFAVNLKLFFKKVFKKKKKKAARNHLGDKRTGQLSSSSGLTSSPTPKAVTGLVCFLGHLSPLLSFYAFSSLFVGKGRVVLWNKDKKQNSSSFLLPLPPLPCSSSSPSCVFGLRSKNLVTYRGN